MPARLGFQQQDNETAVRNLAIDLVRHDTNDAPETDLTKDQARLYIPTLEAIIIAKLTAAYDAKCGQLVIDPPLFTKLVYEGV